jgi:hypothetical protein
METQNPNPNHPQPIKRQKALHSITVIGLHAQKMNLVTHLNKRYTKTWA